MEFLKKLKMYTLLVSLLYAIMGLIMLLNPQFILDAFNYVIGVFALIYGVIYMIKFFINLKLRKVFSTVIKSKI